MAHRTGVIGEQLRQILSSAICFEMRDPDLEGIVFTRVRVSPDLQYADVLFSYAEEEKKLVAVLKALNRARGALKRAISRQVKLRRVPDLRFHVDEDMNAERRIGEILDQLHIPPPENDDP